MKAFGAVFIVLLSLQLAFITADAATTTTIDKSFVKGYLASWGDKDKMSKYISSTSTLRSGFTDFMPVKDAYTGSDEIKEFFGELKRFFSIESVSPTVRGVDATTGIAIVDMKASGKFLSTGTKGSLECVHVLKFTPYGILAYDNIYPKSTADLNSLLKASLTSSQQNLVKLFTICSAASVDDSNHQAFFDLISDDFQFTIANVWPAEANLNLNKDDLISMFEEKELVSSSGDEEPLREYWKRVMIGSWNILDIKMDAEWLPAYEDDSGRMVGIQYIINDEIIAAVYEFDSDNLLVQETVYLHNPNTISNKAVGDIHMKIASVLFGETA